MRTHRQLNLSVWWGFMVVLSLAAAVHAAPIGARVVSVQGIVEIMSAPGGQWSTVASPVTLPPGSAIRTGPNSQAVLELDGAVVTLYDTSLINIPVSASPASTGANPLRHPLLDAGRAVFNVTPTPDRVPFSVRTPTIVAGVKGTVFEVVSTGTHEAVYVWRGVVEVTSLIDPLDVQLVPAGSYTMLDHLRLTPAAPIPSEREHPSDLTSHPPAGITATRDDASPLASAPLMTTWDTADRAALETALDDALDLQTDVSTGDLRVPSSTTLTTDTTSSLTTTADLLASAPSPGLETLLTDPVSGVTTIVADPLGVLGF